MLTDLPKLRRLRRLAERNDWHTDDPLRQSLRLRRWVKALPASLGMLTDGLDALLCLLLTAILDPSHSRRTVQDLLAFAALIHDAGKAETFQRLPDGTTRCPDHEAASARLAPGLCDRCGLTPAETGFVTTVVGGHGEPYDLFKALNGTLARDRLQPIANLATRYGDRFLPLLLLAWGDLATSHLAANQPDKFEAILAFYRQMLVTTLTGSPPHSEEQ